MTQSKKNRKGLNPHPSGIENARSQRLHGKLRVSARRANVIVNAKSKYQGARHQDREERFDRRIRHAARMMRVHRKSDANTENERDVNGDPTQTGQRCRMQVADGECGSNPAPGSTKAADASG